MGLVPEPGMGASDLVLCVFGKLLMTSLVHGLSSMTFGLALQKFLNIE